MSISISPAPEELELLGFAPDARGLMIHVRARRRSVSCPDCGTPSIRVHSRYTRLLADLPWQSTSVRLRVQTRRFFCAESECDRRIFAERLTATAATHARRTHRLAACLHRLGIELGDEAGARFAIYLGVRTSPDTLLRHIRPDAPAAPSAAPRVLGVDAWAYRKGRIYGTILVDPERSRIVDLLPDRSADSFAAWLQAHPGVEVITRDRSGLYEDGAHRGATQAIHVADRWHLVRNLTDAVERVLDGRRALLR